MYRKTKVGIVAISASLFMFIGCGSNDSTTTQNSEVNQTETNTTETMEMNASVRFESLTIEGDVIQRDNQNKLDWVASAGSVSVACAPHAAVTTEESDIASAKAHCDSITFAGYSDWRVPTSNEHVTFITDMNSTGNLPYYLSDKCHRVIGIDNDTTAQTINTHHSDAIGETTPWSTLITQSSDTNYGVKCVRDF